MKKQITKNISYTFITILIFVGGYFILRQGGLDMSDATKDQARWGEITFNTTTTVDEDYEQDIITGSENTDSLAPTDIQDIQKGWLEFESNKFGFSLKYPSYFQVGQFSEGESEVYLFQRAEKAQGIQIYITPLDETFDMTKARILKDIPDMDVREEQVVDLGEVSGKGLAFLSDNEAFGGNSREVWFVYKNNLYQISTYASLDTLLREVLNTWQFN